MSSEIRNHFENLERALKRISIILVDDFDEIQRGSPGPCTSLIRKLLLGTSTAVMKSMLLRGIASHASDKKIILGAYDLLRESIKYSPSITTEQFLSSGFVAHKLQILTKLAEYVGHVDRNISRSPVKTTIVVPSEALKTANSLNATNGPSLNSSIPLFSPANYQQHNSSGYDQNELFSNIDEFHEHQILSNSSFQGNPELTSPMPSSHHLSSRSQTPNKNHIVMEKGGQSKSPNSNGNNLKRSSSAPKIRSNSEQNVTNSAPSRSNSFSSANSASSLARASRQKYQTEDSIAANDSHFVEENSRMVNTHSPNVSSAKKNIVKLDDFLGTLSAESTEEFQNKINQYVDKKVQEIVKERTDQISKEISDKYDFVINKLVAAVDAEFTLLQNRIKILEAQIKN